MKDYWDKDEDNFQAKPPVPLYVWILLAGAIVYLAAAFFLDGKENGNQQISDATIQAHLEAIRLPLKYSLPEDYLEMTGERVELTKGDSK